MLWMPDANGSSSGLLKALRGRLTGIGIENQEIALIALGVLTEIEHLGDGIGDGVKGALADAFAPEPVVLDKAKHRTLIGDGMIHKVDTRPWRYDQQRLARAVAATAKRMCVSRINCRQCRGISRRAAESGPR